MPSHLFTVVLCSNVFIKCKQFFSLWQKEEALDYKDLHRLIKVMQKVEAFGDVATYIVLLSFTSHFP